MLSSNMPVQIENANLEPGRLQLTKIFACLSVILQFNIVLLLIILLNK